MAGAVLARRVKVKVHQLIALLQAMPQDMAVFTTHSQNCCCGECFLPPDEEWEISDPTIRTIDDKEVVIL
jgi:hypothetical protein